jgi:hypothetical protein
MAVNQKLIDASFREAESRVPIDTTGYNIRMSQAKLGIYTDIADTWRKNEEERRKKEQEKEKEKEKKYNDISGEIESMMRKLTSGSEQLGGMNEVNVQKLKQLREEYYSVYGDKEREDEVKLKIEQLSSEINTIAAGFGKFGQAYIDGSINIQSTDPKFYDTFAKIWNKDGEYDDVEFSWGDNNKLSVTIDGETQEVTSLFNGLVSNDSEPANSLGQQGKNMVNVGKVDGGTFNRNDNIRKVKSIISTKEKFTNLTGTDTFGDISYKEALLTNPKIHSILQTLDKDKYDTDKSGAVNAKDFDTPENIEALYNALTNIHDDNFDFETAKQVAAEWYTDGYLNSKFLEGRKILNEKGGGKTQNNYVIEGQYIPKSEVDPTVQLLNSNKDYPDDITFNGVIHKRENGVYQIKDKETNDWIEVTRDELAATIGILSERYGYQREVATSWEDAPGETELKEEERTGMFGMRGIPLYTRPKNK